VPEALHREAEVPWDAVEVSMRLGRLPSYVLLANAMWGRVSDPVLDYGRLGFRDFDEFVVWLEDQYRRRLGEVSFEVLYKTRPSAGERESELHAECKYKYHKAERRLARCAWCPDNAQRCLRARESRHYKRALHSIFEGNKRDKRQAVQQGG
jgi:hypothetical protein